LQKILVARNQDQGVGGFGGICSLPIYFVLTGVGAGGEEAIFWRKVVASGGKGCRHGHIPRYL